MLLNKSIIKGNIFAGIWIKELAGLLPLIWNNAETQCNAGDMRLEKIRNMRRVKRWRSGMEAVISNLKRGFEIRWCVWKGFEHYRQMVFWSIIAYNFRSYYIPKTTKKFLDSRKYFCYTAIVGLLPAVEIFKPCRVLNRSSG
jgi:hypothetical protein